ncbi:uncharacterized protein FOMMEDRAFT_162643 [Fomitiporia mediterranea MF3/22]|uniref:Uncharacterized protein n=1 Tax=Fomitiporia mediterranea (strain MF3/22) TaxID=694068 RepID=R7SH48_FOMME|nr:uncharacterized protein FOMMEDRAFT_162643 [Fomitiporia mediterranea MF3/22]EJC97622.1 hypothetical protein FOMMEDRAFT_162643 [Fomitiporia mediterranea MF3/22]
MAFTWPENYCRVCFSTYLGTAGMKTKLSQTARDGPGRLVIYTDCRSASEGHCRAVYWPNSWRHFDVCGPVIDAPLAVAGLLQVDTFEKLLADELLSEIQQERGSVQNSISLLERDKRTRPRQDSERGRKAGGKTEDLWTLGIQWKRAMKEIRISQARL